MVNESNAAVPSFSSSQTAQSVHAEGTYPGFVVNQNGKVVEIKAQRTTPAVEEKDVKQDLSLTQLECSRTIQNPPNSLGSGEICFQGADWSEDEVEHDDERQEDSEIGSLGRAIITTHISAQKMYHSEQGESFRRYSEDFFYGVDAEGMAKLDGIRVMIEQVIEVEYESDSAQ
jgi:hypothetical protein